MQNQNVLDDLSSYVDKNDLPFVSAIVPMLNEVDNITACLQSLFEQNYPQNHLEIIVVDGGSHDGSIEIVKEFALKHSNIKLLGWPGLNCPAAMNVGILNANPKTRVIAKVDAHGYIDPNYFIAGVRYLIDNGNVKCVGGPIKYITKSRIQVSNTVARSSIFGVGGGTYTYNDTVKIQYVDSVQCGIYDAKTLVDVGMFDEALQFGEDEEVNWRIKLRGYQILLTPEVKFYYYPRPSFGALFRQYRGYGDARVRVLLKHRNYFKLKHLIPFLFVGFLMVFSILGIFIPQFVILLIMLIGLYFALSIFFSVKLSLERHKWWTVFMLPISFACIHFGYGFGFCLGLTKELRNFITR